MSDKPITPYKRSQMLREYWNTDVRRSMDEVRRKARKLAAAEKAKKNEAEMELNAAIETLNSKISDFRSGARGGLGGTAVCP